MAASESTTHYQLPIYQPDDITSWLTDFNGAMQKIDAAIYEVAQGGGGSGINVVQTTGGSETDVMSQAAVTNSLPEIVQSTGDSETKVMSQNAVTSQLSTKIPLTSITQSINVTDPSPILIPSEAAITQFIPASSDPITASTLTNPLTLSTNVQEPLTGLLLAGKKYLVIANMKLKCTGSSSVNQGTVKAGIRIQGLEEETPDSEYILTAARSSTYDRDLTITRIVTNTLNENTAVDVPMINPLPDNMTIVVQPKYTNMLIIPLS